ncbi:restriction endonuclease subunit S [Photobacterium lipolyticum]|uniref:Restriction endonuclease subunit S n=1 Tax=Photobacterium lipolyticum TaxID=266810 RepID=A0A2T3MTQ7_9GAMM|nr:restriction endonuclease subunit S [Photobacterium lipolyticum]PSW02565.1 restriction endonuclease subunit S [Photobacterium lipolyticum]
MHANPYPKYRPTNIGWLSKIPSEWKDTLVKFCFDIQLGKMLQPKQQSLNDVEYPYLKAQHVKWNGVETENLPKMFASKKDINKYSVREGDLLICEGGEVGRASILRQLKEPAIIQNALHRVRNKELGDINYFCYMLRNISDTGWFDILCNKATIAHLTGEKLGAIRFPVPSIEEQQQIAAFLDFKTQQIDRLIEKKKMLIEKLEEKRIAMITKAVTNGLDKNAKLKPSGVDWLGGIPAHWREMQFKDRCRVVSGQVDPTGPDYESLPLIAPDHIEKNSGRLIELVSAKEQGAISGKYLFEKGDILYSKIRPELNKLCIAPSQGLCSADMYAIRTEEELSPLFLFYMMLSKYFFQYAVLESMRVAMPKINRESLGSFKILVPPKNEQKKIVAHISSELKQIEKSIDVSLRSVSKLEEYRSALITSAVTGKIDVREVEIPKAGA